MIKRYLILVSCCLANLPALADKPRIQWDPDYDFSAATTFQWQTTAESSLARSDPFLHSRIVNAIEFQLTEHGLTEVEMSPDVYVTYHASTRTEFDVVSTSVGYDFGGYGRGQWGFYGYGRTGPLVTDNRLIEVEQGTLVVDVWDAASDELIWRGSASEITVSDDPERTQKNVVKTIEKMAKQYDKLRDRED